MSDINNKKVLYVKNFVKKSEWTTAISKKYCNSNFFKKRNELTLIVIKQKISIPDISTSIKINYDLHVTKTSTKTNHVRIKILNKDFF